MGTNYYWRHNICSCCGRYDEWHICKSLVSFEGRFGEPDWDDAARKFLPAPPTVASWRQWRDLIRSGGEVWDEYGKQVDVEEFISDVESTDRANRRRQYDWVVDHPDPFWDRKFGVVSRGEWLDEDGFSFYGGEFS